VSLRDLEVRLLRIAENDLADIVAYIAAERPSAAPGQLAKIEKTLGFLRKNPYLGKLPNDEHLIELGYRCLIIDDYLAFYTVEEQAVLVHRIIHGARDYHTLF
jgi:plasmid stabilization system protein ParE